MEDHQTPRATPPGWYPDQTVAGVLRYWDGERWTDQIAPMQQPNAGAGGMSPQLLAGLLVAAAVVGLILSLQSVTVISGSGIVWTGAAICAGAGIVSWVVKTTPTWVRVVCIIVGFIAITTAFSVESQLDNQRQEIANLLE